MSNRTRVDPLVIRPSDVEPQPWANGLGSTRVLAARSAWRISVAEVEGRMPFTPFLGADRLLIPLTPPGVTLDINGSKSRVPAQSAVTFFGEDHVFIDSGANRISVVNVMARRSSGRMQWAIRPVSGLIDESADAIVVLAGTIEIQGVVAPPGTVIRPGVQAVSVTSAGGVVAVMRVRQGSGVPLRA